MSEKNYTDMKVSELRSDIKGNFEEVKTLSEGVDADSVFDTDYLDHLDRIKCQKHLVIGNHCAERYDQKLLYAKFNKVYGLKKKYGAWLTHAPIHPDELRGKFCIHGHTHNHLIDDSRYINVCPEHHDYMPVNLKDIKEYMKSNPYNL